jgi:hypothetical protein
MQHSLAHVCADVQSLEKLTFLLLTGVKGGVKLHFFLVQKDVAEAQDVLSRARTQRSLVHARGCAEAARSEEAVQKGVKKLDLRDSVGKDKVTAVVLVPILCSSLYTKIDTPRGDVVQKGVKKLDLRDSVGKDKVTAVLLSSAFVFFGLHTGSTPPRGCEGGITARTC